MRPASKWSSVSLLENSSEYADAKSSRMYVPSLAMKSLPICEYVSLPANPPASVRSSEKMPSLAHSFRGIMPGPRPVSLSFPANFMLRPSWKMPSAALSAVGTRPGPRPVSLSFPPNLETRPSRKMPSFAFFCLGMKPAWKDDARPLSSYSDLPCLGPWNMSTWVPVSSPTIPASANLREDLVSSPAPWTLRPDWKMPSSTLFPSAIMPPLPTLRLPACPRPAKRFL
mmetsp:Transcript_11243/g.45365  ORF Transcript_11243/g.45365 Transcript_11243/m.45365 type:complete len:227 (+) Transcript_11243:1782-2462(+)